MTPAPADARPILRSAPWLHLPTVDDPVQDPRYEGHHSVKCPCAACVHADLIDAAPYRPTFALRSIAELWPDVAWLAWLPRTERRWYANHAGALARRYPTVPGEVWARLFP